jgi:bacteriocin-like protein
MADEQTVPSKPQDDIEAAEELTDEALAQVSGGNEVIQVSEILMTKSTDCGSPGVIPTATSFHK